jgi:hypothetical protein
VVVMLARFHRLVLFRPVHPEDQRIDLHLAVQNLGHHLGVRNLALPLGLGRKENLYASKYSTPVYIDCARFSLFIYYTIRIDKYPAIQNKMDCRTMFSGILHETPLGYKEAHNMGRISKGIKGMAVAYLLKQGKKRLLPIIKRKLKSR